MTGQPSEQTSQPERDREQAVRHASVAMRSLGTPNSIAHEFDFWDASYEMRRLFSELLGTFFLVLVAVGGPMVSARFGGNAVPYAAKVVAPALMVASIILFMGTVSGAHLNPAVSIAFAVRGDFPWKRVPAYIVAQFLGGILATLLLWALIGKQGSAGLTLPGPGIGAGTAMVWEIVLTTGLVSVILGTASGAQQIGALAAVGVGGYIALAGLWGSPVSGASMNPARSLGPALVLNDWTAWWAYLIGPIAGGLIAVVFAYVLRGHGGDRGGVSAAQGTLGSGWRPGSPPRRLAAELAEVAGGGKAGADVRAGIAGPHASSHRSGTPADDFPSTRDYQP
jgi:aquaporin Z